MLILLVFVSGLKLLSQGVITHSCEISANAHEKPLARLITNFLLFLAIFLLPLDGARLNFIILRYLIHLKLHTELAEWLLH